MVRAFQIRKLGVTRDHLAGGLRLFERTGSLGAFDAVLAAAATKVGASALVSADAAFAELHEPSHVVPDAAGVERLLRA